MSDQLDLWPEEAPGGRITWSISRNKRLRDCLRRYFLQHYGSRGGSKPEASPEVRDIYMLKHLRNRHMWVGEVVHEMIELTLAAWRRGDTVPVEALVQRGTRRMRAQYAESLQGFYRDRPRHSYGLVEHEYRDEISRQEWKDLRDRMERCLRAFFDLELTATIRETPPWRWLAVESLGSFDVDGTTVVVKPDLAWRDDEEQVVVVDWKTGKQRPDDDWLQMAVYGVFARGAWELKEDSLQRRLAFLDTGDVRVIELAANDLHRAQETIRGSIKEMRRLAVEAWAGNLDPAAFPKTEDVSLCARCSFRRVCERP
ncbi:RecB family exonuclease [Myxococcota bacterium]